MGPKRENLEVSMKKIVIVLFLPLIHGCFSTSERSCEHMANFSDLLFSDSTQSVSVYDETSCIESNYDMAVFRSLVAFPSTNCLWRVKYNIRVTERCVVLGSKMGVLVNVSDSCLISKDVLFELLIRNVYCCSIENAPLYREHYSGSITIYNREDDKSFVDSFFLVRPSSVTDLWNYITNVPAASPCRSCPAHCAD